MRPSLLWLNGIALEEAPFFKEINILTIDEVKHIEVVDGYYSSFSGAYYPRLDDARVESPEQCIGVCLYAENTKNLLQNVVSQQFEYLCGELLELEERLIEEGADPSRVFIARLAETVEEESARVEAFAIAKAIGSAGHKREAQRI